MGGVIKLITQKQKEQIKQLLIAKCGIKKIGKIVGCSNTTVYKVGEKERIRFKNSYKPLDEEKPTEDDFVCPGLNGCVTCKRIFQYPCPFAPKGF